MDDDLQVIERVIAGDLESFRILVRRHERALFCLVRNLIADAGDCEDVAQEVFLAAYTHLGSYDHRRATFVTWLLTIARNKCWNAQKKRRPQTVESLPEAADPCTPESAAVEEESLRQLDEALAALPFAQRTAFVLAEVQGFPLDAIARIEGVRLGTVKSRLGRAREKLRRALRPAVEQP